MESHILPAFVFRWLKERGLSGHIRHSDNPNRRIQDGPKKYWLCENCETRLGQYEREFATHVFHPWLDGQPRIHYQDWLVRFCVSVSWRVLKHCKGFNKETVYTAEQELLVKQADKIWSSFLMGQRPHPGQFVQHLVIHDLIVGGDTAALPRNINSFLLGAVTMDVIGTQTSLLTFAKLGRFEIYGVVQPGSHKWQGTKVGLKGVLPARDVALPRGLLPFFKSKAAVVGRAMDQLSPQQQRSIEAAARKGFEAGRGSEQIAAMSADADLFG